MVERVFPNGLKSRDLVAIVLVVSTSALTYTGHVSNGVGMTLLFSIAGAYGLLSRHREAKEKQTNGGE
jgi:hypothetical protein